MEPYDLNNVLQSYNSITEENDNQEICCICQDIVDNGQQVYELPECNHIFHTNCIITWFRNQNTGCPLCANPGINNKNEKLSRRHYGYFGGWVSAQRMMETTRYKRVVKIITKNDCPKDLKKLYINLMKNIDEFKIIKKNYQKFKTTTKNELAYGAAIKQTEQQLRKIRTMGLKISKQVQEVIEYPIVPLIIPIHQ